MALTQPVSDHCGHLKSERKDGGSHTLLVSPSITPHLKQVSLKEKEREEKREKESRGEERKEILKKKQKEKKLQVDFGKAPIFES